MKNPFAELIGLWFTAARDGRSECWLEASPTLFNPNGVVHGAVPYAMADTDMGAALHSLLSAGEACATVELKISYFKPVTGGTLRCVAEVVNRGRRLANLDAWVYVDEVLMARANGNFAIFPVERE